jgi:type I restriction enzyme S subunit
MDWPTMALGDAIDFFDKKRIPLSSMERSKMQGAFPYYGASGVIDWIDDYIFDGRYLLVAEDGENLNSRKLPLAFFADRKFWVNNHAHVVRGKSGVLDDVFLQQWFAQADIGGYVTGSAQPKLSQANMKRIQIHLPPFPVQQKIASVLSTYDDLIENNNHRIKILEETAQRIYREWFVDFRYPGHEGVSLVDSDLGPIPADWKVCRLGEVCARITDGAHRSPATTDEGMPMASVKDMTPRDLDEEGARRISADDYELLVRQESRPRAGDILISKDGANFLKHVFPLFRDSTAVLLSSVAILTPNDSVSPLVLTLSLRDPENKSRLKGFVSGAAIPRIVLKDFKQHKLVLPPQDLQMLFDSRFGGTLSQSALLSSANRKLREARNLLLPRLMSGEIDVSDLHITFAEAAA